MSLYPSLEDMKVDQMAQAQHKHEAQSRANQVTYPAQGQPPSYPQASAPAYGAVHPGVPTGMDAALYPSLSEYMGMDLTPHLNNQVAVPQQAQGDLYVSKTGSMQVSPVTGNSVALHRSEIKQGVRQVQACKDAKGMIGLRVKSINAGIFICLVHHGSPASLAGLRFGDQILQINGENVAGYSTDKAMNLLKKAKPEKILFAIRDRPFERTITLQKDSSGYVGFVFRDGRIKSLVKDSSAARNGLLIDHQIIEIGGVNAVGLKDKDISKMLDEQGRSVTLTIMPCFLYDHMLKCMGDSLVRKVMDHSIPDV